MVLLQWMLYAWLLIAAGVQVNLYPVRNSGIYSSTAGLSLLLLLTGLLVLRRPSLVFWRSRLTVPLLALATTAVVAGIQGAIFYDRAVEGVHLYLLVQIYAVALVILSVGTPFAVNALVRTARDAWRVRLVLVVAAGLLVANSFVRLPAPTVNWWPLAAAQAAAFVGAWVLFEKHERWLDYLAGALFVGGVAFDVIVFPFLGDVPVQWLSGWIAVGVPIGLLVLIRFPRWCLVLGIPLLAVFAFWQYPNIQRAYVMAYREGDFGRIRLWEDAIKIAYLRPLFGVGPGNYLDYIMRYGEMGWMLSSPHGNYQQIAAEMGLVGLGFFGWLIVRALALGGRLCRASTDPFVRSIAAGALCGIAGQCAAAFVGDFVLPSYHNGGAYMIGATIYVWVTMGLLVSVERLEATRRLTEAAPQTENRDETDQASGEPLDREG